MAIPIHELQATGEYKVPGLHQPVTGYHVREAVKLLGTRDRVAVQQYPARPGRHGVLEGIFAETGGGPTLDAAHPGDAAT